MFAEYNTELGIDLTKTFSLDESEEYTVVLNPTIPEDATEKEHTLNIEYFYEYGLNYNKGTNASNSAIYDKVKRDTFGFGLNYQDKFDIPYITRYWFNNQYFQVSLTAFYEKILNNSRDLIVDGSRNHRLYHSHAASIAWNFMQFWSNNKYALVISGNWAPEINKGFIAPMLAYVPGGERGDGLNFLTKEANDKCVKTTKRRKSRDGTNRETCLPDKAEHWVNRKAEPTGARCGRSCFPV